jgi:hypothetical protein
VIALVQLRMKQTGHNCKKNKEKYCIPWLKLIWFCVVWLVAAECALCVFLPSARNKCGQIL